MGFSSLTHATIGTVHTQQADDSGVADIEVKTDNPPLATPHDNQVPVFEVVLFWFICHSKLAFLNNRIIIMTHDGVVHIC